MGQNWVTTTLVKLGWETKGWLVLWALDIFG
jgi:hypothetical protein